MSSTDQIIACVSHGVYGVQPQDCPCCPICDQPMWKGERITLQTVDAGPGNPDLLRLVHYYCDMPDEEDDE